MTTTYAVRGGAEGARRLDLLDQIMGPVTGAFLAECGIARASWPACATRCARPAR